MPSLPNVLCLGRLYCDVIFTDLPRMPTAGTEVFSGGVGLHVGGGAPITAGHLAALGHRTTLAAFLPPPPFRDIAIAELDRLGVDRSLSRQQTCDMAPQLTAALVHGQERAFVTHRAGPAIPVLSLGDIQGKGITHIHIGEATTLLDNPGLVALAKAIGATLSLDCSWDDDLDTPALADLLPSIDVFLPNEAEVQALQKLGVPERLAMLTIVKMGEDGARALFDGNEIHVPTRTAEPVDTTGAGDAFNAGFLSGWLMKLPLEDCLKAGNAKGSEAVQHRGGLGGLSICAKTPSPVD